MGFDPGLIDWDLGIRGLGSGCPGTGFWVSGDWVLGVRGLGSGSGDRDLGTRGLGFKCPGTRIWASGDCMEGFGEPWRPLERPGDAQKPGL